MSDFESLIRVSCEDYEKAFANYLYEKKRKENKVSEAIRILKETPEKGLINRIFKRTKWDLVSDCWFVSEERYCAFAGIELTLKERRCGFYHKTEVSQMARAISVAEGENFLATKDVALFVERFL